MYIVHSFYGKVVLIRVVTSNLFDIVFSMVLNSK